ncbi:hypothetical protein FRC02_008356 [Tulasnella sp. 418]|nr:hypothetical protein FRC02_008356 [Tulasnella sp. 418]
MGLLSSKPSCSSSSPNSVGTATLNGAHFSLTMLEKVVDGVNIPFVKGVAGVAVEVIKIAKVRRNAKLCRNLAIGPKKRNTSVLVAILGCFSGGKTVDPIPEHLRTGVERLTARATFQPSCNGECDQVNRNMQN